MVVLPLGERVLADVDPHEAAIGLVLDVVADLLLDHVLLVLQRFRVEVQRAHPVRFQPQHRFQRRDRRGFDVVGEVGAGGAVVAAATAGDHAVEHALARLWRALEHQVFEQVRKTRAVARFQAHADAVDHADPDHRRAVVLGHHHGQAVVEFLDRHRHPPLVGVGGSGRAGQRAAGQQEHSLQHHGATPFVVMDGPDGRRPHDAPALRGWPSPGRPRRRAVSPPRRRDGPGRRRPAGPAARFPWPRSPAPPSVR